MNVVQTQPQKYTRTRKQHLHDEGDDKTLSRDTENSLLEFSF